MGLVLTTDSNHFVSLAEVKAHLNKSSTADDPELGMVLGAAEEQTQDLIGPVLWRTVVDRLTVSRTGDLLLSTRPVVSVTTLETDTTPATPITVYTLHSTKGSLSGLTARGDVVATYVAGRTLATDSIRLATLIIADHLWASQQGTAPVNFDEAEPMITTPTGFAIPRRAADLLIPYGLGAVFA